MAVKIRLQRKGRKQAPYYYIVVSDSRSPRDGKFIERLGSYNPNTNPATIELNSEKALEWVNKGAQPTDTVRAILSYKGVMYRKHLAGGVAKGALTQEEADRRFASWLEQKATKIEQKVAGLKDKMNAAQRQRLEAESAVAHKRAQDILARKAAAEAPAEEENTEEAEGETSGAEGEGEAEATADNE